MTALSSEDSLALADTLRKALLARHAFAGGRRSGLAEGPQTLAPICATLGELGLPALLVPPTHGGAGGGVSDLQRVQRELGRALVVDPWFDCVLASRLLLLAGSAAQQDEWLVRVAQGASRLTVAGPGSPRPVQGRRDAGRWRLQGACAGVAHAGTADCVVVRAGLPEGGQAWFLLDPRHPGVQQTWSRRVDHTWVSEMSLDEVAAEPLGHGDPAAHGAAAQAMHRLAVAGRCAEAVGAAEVALELSVQHLRTRRQFGQPLGENQALRHRVAEMVIALEQARSAAEMACEAAEDADDAAAHRRAAQAQLVSSESVTWLVQQAIQLHGGMGMTDEMPLGHHYRRVLVLNACSGGASSALAQLTQYEASTWQ